MCINNVKNRKLFVQKWSNNNKKIQRTLVFQEKAYRQMHFGDIQINEQNEKFVQLI